MQRNDLTKKKRVSTTNTFPLQSTKCTFRNQPSGTLFGEVIWS